MLPTQYAFLLRVKVSSKIWRSNHADPFLIEQRSYLMRSTRRVFPRRSLTCAQLVRQRLQVTSRDACSP